MTVCTKTSVYEREIGISPQLRIVRRPLTPFCSGPNGCSLIIGRGSRPRLGMGEKNFVASSVRSSNDSDKNVKTIKGELSKAVRPTFPYNR
jgi:hypothetical protein